MSDGSFLVERLPDTTRDARWRMACRICRRSWVMTIPLQKFAAFGAEDLAKRESACDIIGRHNLTKDGCTHVRPS